MILRTRNEKRGHHHEKPTHHLDLSQVYYRLRDFGSVSSAPTATTYFGTDDTESCTGDEDQIHIDHKVTETRMFFFQPILTLDSMGQSCLKDDCRCKQELQFACCQCRNADGKNRDNMCCCSRGSSGSDSIHLCDASSMFSLALVCDVDIHQNVSR